MEINIFGDIYFLVNVYFFGKFGKEDFEGRLKANLGNLLSFFSCEGAALDVPEVSPSKPFSPLVMQM